MKTTEIANLTAFLERAQRELDVTKKRLQDLEVESVRHKRAWTKTNHEYSRTRKSLAEQEREVNKLKARINAKATDAGRVRTEERLKNLQAILARFQTEKQSVWRDKRIKGIEANIRNAENELAGNKWPSKNSKS